MTEREGKRRLLRVEVAYALPEEQAVLALEVEEGTTAGEAIERSGIAQRFPGIDIHPDRIGIFGERAGADARLRDGDRVEIYRPLLVDPKEARRRRARR